jgi:hypothetical protein
MGSERKRRREAEARREAESRIVTALRERDATANKENLAGLLEEQRAVLERAAAIIRDAGQQFGAFTREEVTPKVRDTMTNTVKPFLAGGVASAALASTTVKNKIKEGVLPAVSGAVDKASNVGKKLGRELDKEAWNAKAELLAKRFGIAVAKPAPAPTPGPGRYILLGVGVVAVAGLAYAVWQTLRADDDLWIEDEPEAIDEDLAIDPEANAPASNI